MARRGWEQLAQRGRGLAEEANASVGAGRCLDPVWLDGAALWLAEVAPAWEDVAGVVPDGRQYRLVASSMQLEAWLICWPRAGRLELHDHGGASGALQVIEGTLTEQFVAGRRLPARHRRIDAGEGIRFDGDYAHDVVNLDEPCATSVHVYSAASQAMTYYRLSEAGLVALPAKADDATVLGHDAVVDSAGRAPASGSASTSGLVSGEGASSAGAGVGR